MFTQSELIVSFSDHIIRQALDDFGTGYSSLNYLNNMKVDEVKIDKKFLDFLVEDKNALRLFKSIVEIAHSFNYRVVAEGVESLEQFELFVKTGCYEIHFVRGMPRLCKKYNYLWRTL